MAAPTPRPTPTLSQAASHIAAAFRAADPELRGGENAALAAAMLLDERRHIEQEEVLERIASALEASHAEHQGIVEELQQRLDDQYKAANGLAKRNIELASRNAGLVAQLNAESAETS